MYLFVFGQVFFSIKVEKYFMGKTLDIYKYDLDFI